MSEFTQAFDLHNMVPGPDASSVIQVIYKGEDGILNCYGTSAITVLNLEAADTYAPGCIYQLVSGTSSQIFVNKGAAGAVAVFVPIAAAALAAAATTALTDITQTAPGTPDYAIQDLIQPAGFGFTTKDEGNTVLTIVQNNKTRLAEVVAVLVAAGLMTA